MENIRYTICFSVILEHTYNTGKSIHFKDQEDGSNELTDNQAYVTNEKVAPQSKETEFPNYEAIGEEKVGASNESLYDSLAPHPKHTDNPLYSTMGGVTVQIESSPQRFQRSVSYLETKEAHETVQ